MAIKKASSSARMVERRINLRAEVWPDLDPKALWNRKKSDGYTTIPRCMTYILTLIDQLSGKNPLASTYLTLWCHVFDEGFVQIKSEEEFAFESGFTGQRARTTWRNKMKALNELGFIDSSKGKSGDFYYTLIVNPFHIIKKTYLEGSQLISKDTYFSFVERADEVGARDLKD
jgi:hypothetical protein